MKPFAWSPEKNAQLLAERQLCFEAVVVAIEAGDLLDTSRKANRLHTASAPTGPES